MSVWVLVMLRDQELLFFLLLRFDSEIFAETQGKPPLTVGTTRALFPQKV